VAVALQIIASGFAAGAVYGLVAAGQSIVFRLTGVVNFAFGELIALAGAWAGLAAILAAPSAPSTSTRPRVSASMGSPRPSSCGSSRAARLYRTAARSPIAVAAEPAGRGRDWTTTVAVAVGLLLAAAAGLAVWARA
jgi:branched-chain amino acid transport system permease protein